MQLAFVEITEEKAERREGTNERGRWSVTRQKGFLHQGDVYPAPFDLILEDGQLPYKPGRYLFSSGSFNCIKGQWQFSRRINLVPIEEVTKNIKEISAPRGMAA